MMSLADAMGQSSNVAAITLSQQLGKEVYFDYATRFGFGDFTGLQLKGESTGVLRTPSEWRGSDAGSIVIGQGMTVNLMQLAGAFNTVGNGGQYTPIRLVADPFHEADRPQVISPEAAAETLKMLTAVTGDEGTGTKAAIEGYTVAGKTGTAWKVFDNGSGRLTYGSENDRRYLTTFGGLVPAEAPQLSVVLVVDEPRTATSATTAAAPTFAQIAQYALRVLNIAPAGDGTQAGWRQERSLIRGTPAIADDGRRGEEVPPEDVLPSAAPAEEVAGDAGGGSVDDEPPAVIEQPASVDPADEQGGADPNIVSLDLAEGGQ
jgi:cell division protein FtsI (penicillin-binding protein 3)